MSEVRQENKMGVLPIPKLLFSMSGPMIASMLFQALYNIVDSIFVAKLSQDALNAVSLAFPIQILSMAFALGTGVGMNAIISRSLGAKDFEAADRTTNTGIFLYIITAIVISITGLLASRWYYKIQTDNIVIINYGTAYIRICIGICYALFAQICAERLLQSTGRTDLAMIPQITGAVINMILDPIMIFGLLGFPRLEVAGAAVATLCGQVVASIIGFVLNVKKNKEIHIKFSLIRFNKRIAAEIYRIGIPSIIMQAIGSVMNFCLNSILIGFTEAATAVFGAYYKIQSFIFLPVFGMNSAIVPIVSYNYGAKRFDRVKQTTTLSIISSVAIMVFGTILFETIPGTLLSIFSPTEEMLSIGKIALRIIGIHFPLAGFCIVAGSVCQALGKPMYSMITSICRQLVVLLPAAYLLSLTGNLWMVWLAFPISEAVSLAMNIYFLNSTYKSKLSE